MDSQPGPQNCLEVQGETHTLCNDGHHDLVQQKEMFLETHQTL